MSDATDLADRVQQLETQVAELQKAITSNLSSIGVPLIFIIGSGLES
jgi:hypothetical protein